MAFKLFPPWMLELIKGEASLNDLDIPRQLRFTMNPSTRMEMYKRAIAIAEVGALLFQICGCTSMRMLPLDEAEGVLKREVVVILLDGRTVTCDDSRQVGWQVVPATHVSDDTLYSYVSGQPVKIPLNEIAAISTRRFDIGKTIIFAGSAYVVVYVTFWMLFLAAMGDPV